MSSGVVPDRLEPIAAVDLGSNSFHMIVGRLEGGRLMVIDRLRERVRLGGGLDHDGNLSREAIDRAIRCLERFGQRLRAFEGGRVRAVGTNTLRRAKNRAEFLARAEAALGHPIDIIAGREEARLIYLGVAQTTPASERRLVVDIGGGSTEVIIGDGFEVHAADSLYMGCVSFSRRFFDGGGLGEARFERAEIAAQLELEPIVKRYRADGWDRAYGCSGTIHAIHQIVLANGWSDGDINKKALRRLKKALVAARTLDDLELPGLEADRRPVIAGGVAILAAVFSSLRIKAMTPASGALREGTLYDLAGRIRHEDVRDRTINWFSERYGADKRHAERVAETAGALLRQVAEHWRLDEDRAEQLLDWTAALHEIGSAIAHTGYHKHGAYIVAHSDMAGFSREEQNMIAALIEGQRRRVKPETFARLRTGEVELAKQLTAIFRLAVNLQRGRSTTRLPPVVLRAKKRELTLAFPGGWLDEHPLTRTQLKRETKHQAELGFTLKVHEST